MKSLLSILVLGLLTTSIAQARLPVNESLSDAVTEKFFTEANNSETGLGES